MTTMKTRTRITLSPEATKIVFDPGATGELAQLWVRYVKGMVVEDGIDLEDVVAPDVRCIDLDLAGYPSGVEGLRAFRDAVRTAAPDLGMHVLYMTAYTHRSTIDAVMRCTATVPDRAVGTQQASWDVRTLSRFRNGMMVERWDRAELPAFISRSRIAA